MKSTHNPAYHQALDALVAARKQRAVTQMELAQALRRPQSFVSKTEGRERRLDIVEFIEICRLLGVNPVVILREAQLISDADLLAAGEDGSGGSSGGTG